MNSTPRFLCDEMLDRLCRYLRAAGYDALLANGGRSDGARARRCDQAGSIARHVDGFTGAARTTSACAQSWSHGSRLEQRHLPRP